MSNWRDELPDDLKTNEALSNFESVDQLAKSFVETKKFQGESIRIPGEDAGEDAVKEFNEKLLAKVPTLMPKPDLESGEQAETFFRSIGMPAKPDEYSLPEIEGPEDFQPNSAKIDKFREAAHQLGITKKQFEGLTKELIGFDIEQYNGTKEAIEANKAAMKEKWGMAHDDNLKLVKSAIAKTEAPEALAKSVEDGSASPEVMSWLLSVGKQFGAEGFVPSDETKGKIGEGSMTPEEAQAAIDEINNNPDHAYWKGTGDEKKRAIDRMIKLQMYANPGISTELQRA